MRTAFLFGSGVIVGCLIRQKSDQLLSKTAHRLVDMVFGKLPDNA